MGRDEDLVFLENFLNNEFLRDFPRMTKSSTRLDTVGRGNGLFEKEKENENDWISP